MGTAGLEPTEVRAILHAASTLEVQGGKEFYDPTPMTQITALAQDAKLVGQWTFEGATAKGNVPPKAGSVAGSFDPRSAAVRPLSGEVSALRIYGNGTSPGFSVPRDHAIQRRLRSAPGYRTRNGVNGLHPSA